jgi:hypothetical protein
MQESRLLSFVIQSVAAGVMASAFVGPVQAADDVERVDLQVTAGGYDHAIRLAEGSDGVRIRLNADRDLDLQLYDGRAAVLGYPGGQINSSGEVSADYAGMTISYSGYNGDGSGAGREWLEIQGPLTRTLDVYVHGYQSGSGYLEYESGASETADVTYRLLGELPEGALASTLEVVGDMVWVGSDRGLYRMRIDGDSSWTKVADFSSPVSDVLVHPVDPRLVMVALSDVEDLSVPPVWRSMDDGENWQAVDGVFERGGDRWVGIHELMYEPGTGAILASGGGEAMAMSDNAGVNWRWLNGSEDSFGYPCVLGRLPAMPGAVYQGCEAAAMDVVNVFRFRLADGDRQPSSQCHHALGCGAGACLHRRGRRTATSGQ